jgi:hypothetical protein
MGFNWICAGYNYSQQFTIFECVPKWYGIPIFSDHVKGKILESR